MRYVQLKKTHNSKFNSFFFFKSVLIFLPIFIMKIALPWASLWARKLKMLHLKMASISLGLRNRTGFFNRYLESKNLYIVTAGKTLKVLCTYIYIQFDIFTQNSKTVNFTHVFILAFFMRYISGAQHKLCVTTSFKVAKNFYWSLNSIKFI